MEASYRLFFIGQGFRNQLRADGRLADGVAGIQTLEKDESCLTLCEGEVAVMKDMPREKRGDRFITDVDKCSWNYTELIRKPSRMPSPGTH